jgi:hypothetical protein
MSLKIDVLDMITEYLEQHGYHGLYNPDGECACTPPGLAPCGNMSQHCVAGWMAPCDCGEHDWHITSEPRATPQPVAPVASVALKRIAELDLLYQATMADLAMLHREHQGAKEDLAYWMARAEENKGRLVEEPPEPDPAIKAAYAAACADKLRFPPANGAQCPEAEGRKIEPPSEPVKDHCSRCLWWTTRHCPDGRPAPGSQDACKLFKPKL